MRDARDGFLQCEAEDKVRQLDELRPHLMEDIPRANPVRTHTPVEHLDRHTVLNVLETVSGETDLERLITTVMGVGLEHAGAERGLLVLPAGDAFQIEAEGEVTSDGVRVTLRQSAVTDEKIPESVFNYVLRKNQNGTS
jgi:hypothetical protein